MGHMMLPVRLLLQFSGLMAMLWRLQCWVARTCPHRMTLNSGSRHLAAGCAFMMVVHASNKYLRAARRLQPFALSQQLDVEWSSVLRAVA